MVIRDELTNQHEKHKCQEPVQFAYANTVPNRGDRRRKDCDYNGIEPGGNGKVSRPHMCRDFPGAASIRTGSHFARSIRRQPEFHRSEGDLANHMAKDTKFKPGQSGNPATQFKPG